MGTTQKVVIADTCATYANAIFDHYQSMNSLSLLLGAIYFAFQIYGDFSGYSDMAIGISKLFGLELLRNFNYPYFLEILLNFGENGTFHYRLGLEIMFISPLAEVKEVEQNKFVMFLSSSY